MSTISACSNKRYLGRIDFNKDENDSIEIVSPQVVLNEEIIGGLSKINTDIFGELFKQWDKYNSDSILRSIGWFSKGLSETNYINKFVSIWIASEIINARLSTNQNKKNPLYGKARSFISKIFKRNEIDRWVGLRTVCENHVQELRFNKVKNLRDKILHGANIGPKMTNEINTSTKMLTRLYVNALGEILHLKRSTIEEILKREPRKLPTENYYVIKREFVYKNKELLWERFPSIIIKENKRTYYIKEGKITFDISDNIKFDMDDDCKLIGQGAVEYRGDIQQKIAVSDGKININ